MCENNRKLIKISVKLFNAKQDGPSRAYLLCVFVVAFACPNKSDYAENSLKYATVIKIFARFGAVKMNWSQMKRLNKLIVTFYSFMAAVNSAGITFGRLVTFQMCQNLNG